MNAVLKEDALPRRNIDTSALLVEINISCWTARRLDRSISDEVNTEKRANRGAARVTKNLLADRPELEAIQKHCSAARTYLYTHTLPWSDSGLRLLPTIKFMKFNQRMGDFEAQFDDLVNSFIEVYPTLITAQAMALGDMFDRNEYPTPESIKRKFSFGVNFLPIPDAGDFRVDVGNAAQEELRVELQRLSDERVANAMSDIKARVGEHLERMSDRLTVDVQDGEEKPRRFHGSLIDTARDLCDLAKELNVVRDVELEKARLALKDAIKDYTADDLRDNFETRASVKKQVDRVLEKFVWEKDE